MKYFRMPQLSTKLVACCAQGCDEMINCRSKLIIFLLPEIKKYLKQQATDDLACSVIQRAIKVSSNFSKQKLFPIYVRFVALLA